MLSAGQRTSRVRFDKRIEVNPDAPDDFGNVESGWVPLAEVWAGFLPQPVRERLAAGAPQAGMIGVLTVLRFEHTEAVDEGCRVVFLAGPWRGQVGNVRAIVPTADNREIAFTIETGVAG
ncbi:MAG: head-tail adaptor protein [Hyphomicrobiales bacterium]|nr:MAG: head-tail adaptor protein [Hyphomicrobiales bacterium]